MEPIQVDDSQNEATKAKDFATALTQELEGIMQEDDKSEKLEDDAAMRVEEVLKKCIQEKACSTPSTRSGSSTPMGTDGESSCASSLPGSPMSAKDITPAAQRFLEKSKEAGDVGEFDIRGNAIGNLWSSRVMADPALREAYQALSGPGVRAKQAEFRKAWARGLWDIVERSKCHDKYEETQDGVRSVFVPVKRWLHLEGGGAEAAAGMKHMLEKALKTNTIDQYFEVHPDTGRLTVALPQRHKSQMSGDRFVLRHKSNAKAEPTSSSQASQLQQSHAEPPQPDAVQPKTEAKVKRNQDKDDEPKVAKKSKSEHTEGVGGIMERVGSPQKGHRKGNLFIVRCAARDQDSQCGMGRSTA